MLEIKTSEENDVYYVAKLGDKFVYSEGKSLVITSEMSDKVKMNFQYTHAMRRQQLAGLEIFKVITSVKTTIETTRQEVFCPDPYANRKVKSHGQIQQSTVSE